MADERARRQGALFAAGMGAVAGAALGSGGGPRRTTVTAAAGAVALAATDALAKRRQKPNEIPALLEPHRRQRRARLPAGLGARPARGSRPARRRADDGLARRRLGVRPQKDRARSGGRPGRGPCRSPGGRRGRAGRLRDDGHLPHGVRRPLPRRAGHAARRPRAGRGTAVRRAARRADRYVGTGYVGDSPRARRHVPGGRARRRHRRLARRARRPRLRPRRRTTPGARVLRAHDPVPRSTSCPSGGLGAAGLPALSHARRAPARPGERPDEPARGAARRPQPHRHDHADRRGRRRPSAAGSAPSPTATSPSTSASTPPTGDGECGYVSVGFPLPQAKLHRDPAPQARPAAACPHQPQRDSTTRGTT